MKTFWEKLSITKLVLLLLVVSLIGIEVYRVIQGWDISDLFTNVVVMVVSFYFGQKWITYKKTDSLVDWEDEWEQTLEH